MEFAAVHDAGDDFTHVIRFARVGRDHAIEFFRAVQRRHGCAQGLLRLLFPVQAGHGLARQRECVRVVLRQVIGHTRKPGMHITAAQVFGSDHFARGSFHQRRAALGKSCPDSSQ